MGVLICFEGIDGSGKSTQVKLTKEWLEGLGYHVTVTKWNSSPLFKGSIKKAKQERAFVPCSYSLAHAVDFADRYYREILPALSEGNIVLCDRYIPTAIARDNIRGCPVKWINTVYSFAKKPDLLFYFDINVKIALNRIMMDKEEPSYYEAGLDIFPNENSKLAFLDYQSRLQSIYELFIHKNAFLKADGAMESISKEIKTRIEKAIELPSAKSEGEKLRCGKCSKK